MPPPFRGVPTDDWLAYQLDGIERPDLLPAFEESARSHGCATQKVGYQSSPNIGGLGFGYYGISASCDEGTIALLSLVGGRVRVGCAQPTTRESCDALLRRISESR